LPVRSFALPLRFVEGGSVSFFSRASIENIDAVTSKASGIIDAATGEVAFMIPIRSFEFHQSLMKEHFNDKYMESDKFPHATFQGKISGFERDKPGSQPVQAIGKMTIHGQTREITVTGTIEMETGKIKMKSVFPVVLQDYKIKIPKLLWQNIAEQVEVKLDLIFNAQ
jgi:polyisoprenoid-binding protein YceI